MAFVQVSTDILYFAATSLESTAGTLNLANAAAALPTGQLAAAASDEVSNAIANFLANHGQRYQVAAEQFAASYNQFTRTLLDGTNAYVASEAANVARVASSNAGQINQAVQQLMSNTLGGDGAASGIADTIAQIVPDAGDPIILINQNLGGVFGGDGGKSGIDGTWLIPPTEGPDMGGDGGAGGR